MLPPTRSVCLVSGSWPPEVCGVGDYAAILADTLDQAGCQVSTLRLGTWGMGGIGPLRDFLRDCQADIVHIQYPSRGYGRSILPAMIPLLTRKPVVVTLHEFEIFRWYRMPWFHPFARFTAARVFSRQAEQAAFAARFSRRRGRDRIIPIGSNIPLAAPRKRQPDSVAFFGLFWPGKGLESFLEFAADLRANADGPIPISIIGAPVDEHQEFARHVRAVAADLDIRLHENRPAAEVGDRLAEHVYAYLPFPGGVDERRGSMAAALANGCLILTPHGPHTPDWLREATIAAGSAGEASTIVRAGLDGTRRAELMPLVEAAAARFDWSEIARRHLELYDEVLAATDARG